MLGGDAIVVQQASVWTTQLDYCIIRGTAKNKTLIVIAAYNGAKLGGRAQWVVLTKEFSITAPNDCLNQLRRRCLITARH